MSCPAVVVKEETSLFKRNNIMKEIDNKDVRRAEMVSGNFDHAEELGNNLFFITPDTPASVPDLPHLKEKPLHHSPVADGSIHLDEELEVIKKEAFRKGFAAAEKKLSAFSMAVTELSRLRESLLLSNTEEMVNLVMTISEQVIQTEITSRPETIILETITSAIRSALSSDEFLILVHPDDLQFVVDSRLMLLARISTLKNITIQGDEKIERGGCILQSALGDVDATLRSKLQKIRAYLLENISKHDQRHRSENPSS